MGSRACRYTEPQWGVTVSGCNYPASTPGSTNRGDLAARPLRTVPALPPRKTRHSPTRTHLQNHTVARIVAPSHRLDLVQIAGKHNLPATIPPQISAPDPVNRRYLGTKRQSLHINPATPAPHNHTGQLTGPKLHSPPKLRGS